MDDWTASEEIDVLALGSAMGDGAGIEVNVRGHSWWVCEASEDGIILHSGTSANRWQARRDGLRWAIEYLEAALASAKAHLQGEDYYIARPHLRPEGV